MRPFVVRRQSIRLQEVSDEVRDVDPRKARLVEAMAEDEQRAVSAEYFALADDPRASERRAPSGIETATTVRVQDGQTLTTDGPFADTKEVFGGLYVFEADNLDEAIELAARIPAARLGGAIEVRPVVER